MNCPATSSIPCETAFVAASACALTISCCCWRCNFSTSSSLIKTFSRPSHSKSFMTCLSASLRLIPENNVCCANGICDICIRSGKRFSLFSRRIAFSISIAFTFIFGVNWTSSRRIVPKFISPGFSGSVIWKTNSSSPCC